MLYPLARQRISRPAAVVRAIEQTPHRNPRAAKRHETPNSSKFRTPPSARTPPDQQRESLGFARRSACGGIGGPWGRVGCSRIRLCAPAPQCPIYAARQTRPSPV